MNSRRERERIRDDDWDIGEMVKERE